MAGNRKSTRKTKAGAAAKRKPGRKVKVDKPPRLGSKSGG